MREFIEVVCGVIGIIIVTIMSVFSIAFGINAIGYHMDNVPITVKQDNKILYQGRSACVSCASTGDTTRVDIHRGLFCMFPQAYYVGKNITIEGTK